jgi:hypothetical protein
MSRRRKRIYVAGPMTNREHFNFPAFDDAKRVLLNHGWVVESPADIDRKQFNFDGMGMKGTEPIDENLLKEIAVRDILAIRDCDAIYMLEGWQDSVGANAELAFAEWIGLEIIFQVDADAADYVGDTVCQPEGILQTAIEITSGDRRRDYDKATPNHERIASLWNAYIKARKHPDSEMSPSDVALMMVLLKIARGAYTPTRDTAVDIAGYARCFAQINKFEVE